LQGLKLNWTYSKFWEILYNDYWSNLMPKKDPIIQKVTFVNWIFLLLFLRFDFFFRTSFKKAVAVTIEPDKGILFELVNSNFFLPQSTNLEFGFFGNIKKLTAKKCCWFVNGIRPRCFRPNKKWTGNEEKTKKKHYFTWRRWSSEKPAKTTF
jgi:hypothetical protein